MVADVAYDDRLRWAAFSHLGLLLQRSPDGTLASRDINTFPYEGRATPLWTLPGWQLRIGSTYGRSPACGCTNP